MSAAREQFPWRRMMELGLGTLRLSPRDFWAATPREIAAAFGTASQTSLSRFEFDDLTRKFPDRP